MAYQGLLEQTAMELGSFLMRSALGASLHVYSISFGFGNDDLKGGDWQICKCFQLMAAKEKE